MPVEPPPPEELERLSAILHAAIRANNNNLWAEIGLDGRQTLIACIAALEVEMEAWFDRLLAFAQEQGWSDTRIKNYLRPTITSLKKHGRQRRREADDQDTQARRDADNVRRMSQRTNTRERQDRTSAHAAATQLSPDEMIESRSARLITIGTLLKYRAGRIWHDTFHLDHFINWNGNNDLTPIPPRPIDEEVENNLITWLHGVDARLGRSAITELRAGIAHVAFMDQRNEPQQWLEGLKWDGRFRLMRLFPTGFAAGDAIYTQEAGRCWMVSMVARVMEPGCKVDTLPVLQAGEGVKKGQALEVIGGKYYRAATAKMGDKDFLQQMIGAIVFELPEMHSFTGRGRNTEEGKFVITNRQDYFRAPYERKPSNHPRTAVMAATTNKRRWMHDFGPGRRYDPVFCGNIDLGWLREHREQLWAEAVAYWRLGVDDARGCWWNQPEVEHAELIEASRVELEFVAEVQAWLPTFEYYDGVSAVQPTALVEHRTNDAQGGNERVEMVWGTLLTTMRIARQCLGLTPEMASRNNNAHKIAEAMEALEFVSYQRRIHGTETRVRFWARADRPDDVITLAGQPEQRSDPDMPF